MRLLSLKSVKNILMITLTLFGALIITGLVSFYTSFVSMQKDLEWMKAEKMMQDPVPNMMCRERYIDCKERIKDHKDEEHDDG